MPVWQAVSTVSLLPTRHLGQDSPFRPFNHGAAQPEFGRQLRQILMCVSRPGLFSARFNKARSTKSPSSLHLWFGIKHG
eukprot:365105-Chlamydomonas_euryale.AAC.6